jgi:hypothetical protein
MRRARWDHRVAILVRIDAHVEQHRALHLDHLLIFASSSSGVDARKPTAP